MFGAKSPVLSRSGTFFSGGPFFFSVFYECQYPQPRLRNHFYFLSSIKISYAIFFEQELNKDAEENVIFSLLLSALHEVFLSSRSELHLARK